ncbi:hypothetical protein LZQ00_17165 [Sphingobacterium sp. SRCM116780]|uniref:hypothetical protein n=1 Tax=Sphingobacterium sp. SRCM116780 TaxID=2907623 RepID=UPI001F1D3665|nr:hypothetical protein [Sphingobacterium sp. SRCM116780]UIR55980.1 hypothetical protein LZQ00_17165 [Sphingobacterium sp. SRCM116780]
MYTSLLLIILMACLLFYHTSKKVKFKNRSTWLEKLCAQKTFARIISIVLFLLAGYMSMYLQGAGAGFFALFAYVMAMMSLVILLRPYTYLKWQHILGLYLICLFFEIFIF